VGAGIIALTASQSAYQAAWTTVSLPIITVTDPVISSAVGGAIFGEVLHLNDATAPIAVAAIGLMVAGLGLLSRSPHVIDTASLEAVDTPTAQVEK
jgi:hypothetical protein